jgi:superfamily II DNA helicase RecQ
MAVNALEETLSDISSLLGFEFMQLKPEQKKSIINLLRGEDVYIATLPTGYGKSLIFQLLCIIAKSKLATCQHEQGSNIS